MNPVTNPFQFLGLSLQSALNTYLIDAVNRLIAAISPLAYSCILLYIMLWTYLVLLGRISRPAKEGLLKGIVILAIMGLALNADTYLAWVVGSLQGLEAGITAAVGGSDGTSVYTVLDDGLSKGLALVGQCTENATRAGWYYMGTMVNWYITAGALAVALGMVIVTGGLAILLAKLLLTVLFALGPLCILCLIHPAMASYFDGWFKQAVTFILQIALATAVVAVAIRLFGEAVKYIDLSPTTSQNPVLSSLVMLVIGIGLQATVAGSATVAGRVAGGVSGGVMRATDAARTAIAPARAAYNVANRTSTRLDPRTGYPTTASRLEHIAMGRTVAAPAYRQVLLENMRNGWKKPPGGSIQPSSSAPAASSRPAPGSRQALLERLRSYGSQPPPRGDS